MRETTTATMWRNLTGSTCFAALIVAGSITPTIAEDEKAFGGLEEIVITASKREQTLQEAGMAVTAIGAQDLERMGATSFADFAVRVPNLGFGNESDGRFNSNSPAIRGVFGANTTGFYIDDTPVPMSIQPRVIDVSRIEVLRGPQGSLYGARSMGGTIRLITQQPDFDGVSGSAHATLSTVKEGDINWSVDASANLPIVEDKLAIRVTAYYGQNSGIFDRVYAPTYEGFIINDLGEGTATDPAVTELPNIVGILGLDEWVPTTFNNPAPAFEKRENVDDERYGGFQLVAKAQIAENLTFIPKFMYQKIDADGLPFADNEPGNFTRSRFFDNEEPGSDRWWLASGTLNWDLDSGTIVSTTSYFDRFLNEAEEEASFLNSLLNNHPVLRPLSLGPVIPVASIITESEAFTSFSHETRYTSDFEGPFQFTAGVFYQRTKNHLQYPAALAVGLNQAAGGGAFGLVPGDLIFVTENFFNTKEYAVFGEATFDITDAISITAGGRWYKTETDAFIESDGFANDGPSRVPGDLSLDTVDQSESGFNPKVLIQANISEEMDVYASASKGFRIGGANGNLPATLCGDELNDLNLNPDDVQTYDSDSLWSYEAGIKTSLADNRVSLNAAVYFIKWSDISQQNRLGCGFQYIANAGKAEIKGFEIELMAAPIDGLTLTFALGYADAKITDAQGVAGVSEGDIIQGVPNWTVAASGEYIFPLTSEMDGIIRADFNYYGRSFSTNNGDQRERPSWTALNLRAGVIRDDWEITLFVDNLTNEHANLADSRSIAAETPGRQRLVTNRPRTIGIDVRTRF